MKISTPGADQSLKKKKKKKKKRNNVWHKLVE